MRATCLIKDLPVYRREAFVTGLQAAGCVVGPMPVSWGPDDLLVMWNRQRGNHTLALEVERCGGAVVVAENGYIGADAEGRHLFALALDHHNGAGRWPVGGPERWDALGIDLRPWREDGGHVLVLPQRGIGAPGVAMPKSWPADAYDRLRRATERLVRVRPHPGTGRPAVPLSEDLDGAWCAVTWGSGAGINALAYGVPVFHSMPGWIGAAAAGRLLEDVEFPVMGDRMAMFRRLAWAQWSAAEIATGEPFRRLIGLHRERVAA